MTGTAMLKAPNVPVSWGELIDKITILEIKSRRLSNPTALTNVRRELSLLREIGEQGLTGNAEVLELEKQLGSINDMLWEIEDKIREKEALGVFDEGFIAL